MINNACLSDYVAHIYSVLDIDFIYLFTYFYMSATTNIYGKKIFTDLPIRPVGGG